MASFVAVLLANLEEAVGVTTRQHAAQLMGQLCVSPHRGMHKRVEASKQVAPSRATARAHAAGAAAGQALSSQPTRERLATRSSASRCHRRSLGSASAVSPDTSLL